MEPRPIGFDVANAGVEGELPSSDHFWIINLHCHFFAVFFLQICTEMIDAFSIHPEQPWAITCSPEKCHSWVQLSKNFERKIVIILTHQFKDLFWVLKRTVSLRRFF